MQSDVGRMNGFVFLCHYCCLDCAFNLLLILLSLTWFACSPQKQPLQLVYPCYKKNSISGACCLYLFTIAQVQGHLGRVMQWENKANCVQTGRQADVHSCSQKSDEVFK